MVYHINEKVVLRATTLKLLMVQSWTFTRVKVLVSNWSYIKFIVIEKMNDHQAAILNFG